MEKSITIYGMKISPRVRLVLMTCEVLGIQYEIKNVSIEDGEHKSREYLKINPQHNIPALVDGDLTLNESHAIAAYLANKYSADNTIYPTDPTIRAKVDQMMYFDTNLLSKTFGEIVYRLLYGKTIQIDLEKMERLHEILRWVSEFIEVTGYVAGTETMSIADLCITATLSTLCASNLIEDFDSRYPKLFSYTQKMKSEIPNYEKADGCGAKAFGIWTREAIAQGKR